MKSEGVAGVVGAPGRGSISGPVWIPARRCDGSRVFDDNSYGVEAKRAAGLGVSSSIIIIKKY